MIFQLHKKHKFKQPESVVPPEHDVLKLRVHKKGFASEWKR